MTKENKSVKKSLIDLHTFQVITHYTRELIHCVPPELLCFFKNTVCLQDSREHKGCPQLRAELHRRNFENLQRIPKDSPFAERSVTGNL
jgi:hypothetical protein